MRRSPSKGVCFSGWGRYRNSLLVVIIVSGLAGRENMRVFGERFSIFFPSMKWMGDGLTTLR